MGQLTEYGGKIRYNKSRVVRMAYSSWRAQKTRCYNKNNIKNSTYWGRGIEVRYKLRQFISWYLKNIKAFRGKDPTVGRIDHYGHYDFNNIKIESRSSNSRERMLRDNPSIKKRKQIYIYDSSGLFISKAQTTRDAARITGVSKSGVHYRLSNPVIWSNLNYTFSYKPL